MRWLDNLRLSTELAGVPERCVHVGDRESDIYELFCLAQDLGTRFLVTRESLVSDEQKRMTLEAQAGDIVLVAGKGHEQGQIIGSGDTMKILPFDDVSVAREAAAAGVSA